MLGQGGVGRFERRQFCQCLLVGRLGRPLHLVETLFHRGQVGQRELEFDDLLVTRRVGLPHDVGDIVVGKTPDDMHNGVGLADVLQELVAKAFTLRRALHESGDIHELHHRRHRALGLHDFRQACQARVRHLHHADIRFDRAERIVGRFRLWQT